MKKNTYTYLLITLLLIFLSPSAMAQSVSITSMFVSFKDSAQQLIKLVYYASGLIGIYLIIGSFFKLIQVSTSNGQLTIKTPIIMFICGIGLIALLTSFKVISETMLMGSTPGDVFLSNSSSISSNTSAVISGVLTFVQLIGYIAFVRGWLLINQAGQGKEGALGRGLTHLFGGVAAINIKITAKILMMSLAPGLPGIF